MESEKNTNTVSQTNTTTMTKDETGYEGDLKSLIDVSNGKYDYTIPAPLFLMFAEYLGYVGKTLPWVDSWCTAKKKPEPYKIKFIEVEAVTVLQEAMKKFPIEKLRELYDSLYDVILYIYDENLKETNNSIII